MPYPTRTYGASRYRSALAPRLLLAAAGLGVGAGAAATDYTWNTAASGVFSNTTLWTPTGAPSAADDTALIDLAGVYTVTMDVDLAIDALTLDAADAMLFAQSRMIDLGSMLAITAGAMESRSSTVGGAGVLEIGAAGMLQARGLTTLNADSDNHGLLWVAGSSAGGHATMTVNSFLSNEGTLRMEAVTSGWNSNITIGAGGVIDNAASGVLEVNANGGSRTISGGSLINRGDIVTNAFVVLTGVNFDAAGGQIGDQHRFLNSTISVSASAGGGATLHLEGAGNTLVTDNLASTTLWARGASAGGHMTLMLDDGLSNHGVVRMESINSGWNVTLNGSGGMFHNAADGLFEVNAGTGGTRSFVGSFRNEGALSIGAGTRLTVSDTTPYSFEQQAGSINATGELRLLGADFSFTGGTIDGVVRVDDGVIDIVSTAGAGVVQATSATTITNNSSTLTTIWVQGNSDTDHADIGLTADAENRGVIRMESINSGWRSRINTGAFTLTNQDGAVIEANIGTGGERSFRGAMVNRGQVVVGAGAFLNIVADYTADGGDISGNHAFSENSVLRTIASPTLRGDLSTMVAVGSLIQFEGDLLSGYELWVRGGGFGNNAVTTMTTDDATNRGVIRLESIDSAWNVTLTMGASTYTNGTTGLLDVRVGSGGGRTITGDAYTFTNRGDINIEVGQTLSFTSVGGHTLRQAQGEINADGLLDVVNGYFNYTGGDVDGSVRVSNGDIRVTAGVTSEGEVIAAGVTDLRDNLSPQTTVWVQGSGARGSATLLASNPDGDAVTNLGTIRMESINSAWDSNIGAGPDELVNGSTGVVSVGLGSGGLRDIAAIFRNQGLVQVDDGASMRFNGASYTGDGGAVFGSHRFLNSTLAFTADAGLQHTLIIDGAANVLTTDITAGHELWVRGGGSSAATLALPDAGQNHGVLRFESINSAWQSGASVAGNGRYTNAADGQFLVELGSAGPRDMGLLFENAGEAVFNTGATFTGDADVGSVLNSGQWTMNTTGTVTLNSSVATRTTFENSGVLSGVGTIRIDSGDGLFINSGTLSPGMSTGLLAFDSHFEQTSTGVLEIELAAHGTANGDRLTITETASLDGALEVTLLDSYTPDWGDRWSILTYDSATGDLDLTAPALADPLLLWWTEVTPDSFDLGVRHIADVNHDDAVDFADLNLVVSFFNMFGDDLPGDANEDGAVDFADLNLVVSFFNTQAPANVPAPAGGALAILALASAGRRRR